MSNVIAVYPGTFDPMTLGHEDVVRRATQLFSHVIVAVAAGHHKKALFSLQERIEMAREGDQVDGAMDDGQGGAGRGRLARARERAAEDAARHLVVLSRALVRGCA